MMRVIVTGATGNVGTSVMSALGGSEEVEEILGIARRRPDLDLPKATWREVDILDAELTEVFRGADAVIHLAWAIQPSHDPHLLERVNVEGSRRVFEAAMEAGVGKLVYASSIGAYAPGPKDREVDESWPIGETPTSFYSRHKVAVERLLDRLEGQAGETKVVRLRPALIFKGEAATEIRRLFAGPFLPSILLRSQWVPLLPRIGGLRVQAVHSADVGDAYMRATTRDVEGAFNIAADPPLDAEKLAELIGARTFPVSPRLARVLADLSWRLRLQPSPPGWLDMALRVPLLSAQRARRELGWEPRFTAVEAGEELLRGMRLGRGYPTPPLQEAGAGGRLDEIRTGVGGRQWRRDRDEQLIKYLADLHSIEKQALSQMRAAPAIAGEERLRRIFRQHLHETEGHERRVRERLKAHGAEPSAFKDLAGRGGAFGMLAFAVSQPDTPGKLTAHAFSYEHMEEAAYALLQQLAERAGDEPTAEMAREIAAEEQAMAGRLQDSFDAAAEASLGTASSEDIDRQLNGYLADAHAIEQQALKLLEAAPAKVEDEQLAGILREHLAETRRHAELVEGRLAARGAKASAIKDAALRLGGLNLGAFFGAQPDTTTKLAGFAYAFEHLEVAAYELLKRVAERAGDTETASMAEGILDEERQMAERVKDTWKRTSVALGVAS